MDAEISLNVTEAQKDIEALTFDLSKLQHTTTWQNYAMTLNCFNMKRKII